MEISCFSFFLLINDPGQFVRRSQQVERCRWPLWLSPSPLPLQLVTDHSQLAPNSSGCLVTDPVMQICFLFQSILHMYSNKKTQIYKISCITLNQSVNIFGLGFIALFFFAFFPCKYVCGIPEVQAKQDAGVYFTRSSLEGDNLNPLSRLFHHLLFYKGTRAMQK